MQYSRYHIELPLEHVRVATHRSATRHAQPRITVSVLFRFPSLSSCHRLFLPTQSLSLFYGADPA